MRWRELRWTVPALLVALAARSGAAQARTGGLPAVPVVHGPLAIAVAYPDSGRVAATDSTFLYGTVGDGRATLTIDGQPARVAANGAWIAWIALPRDSSFVLHLVARRGPDSAVASLPLARAGWVRATGAWVDRSSFDPVGTVWLPAGEALPIAVRAAAGASVRLILPGGGAIVLHADSIRPPVPSGIRDFDRNDTNLVRPVSRDRYVGVLSGALDPSSAPDWLAPSAAVSPGTATLEVAFDGDTTRTPWPVQVTRLATPPVSVVLDDDPSNRGGTDRLTVGRAMPGGTYTWFFPLGTSTRADARIGDLVRLRLSRANIAWVPATDVHAAGVRDDPRAAVLGTLTLTAEPFGTELRIPLSRPVPMQVVEHPDRLTLVFYGATSDANWTRYGAGQRFVRVLTWEQRTADEVALDVTFDRPLWGWRSRVDGTDLVVDFRRPPAVDARRPLAGRLIVVDAGHPPGGACGPTGLCEPEANLAVAQVVQQRLRALGARVVMTRSDSAPVGLWPRVALADSVNADLLVSIHDNGLPDGVNPFTNNGTSTFFNHLQALDLAEQVQTGLVANLGLRDLGVSRGDLALCRPTWYPAILTEGLFMMMPAQEAALRTPAGRSRYAAGIVAGITAFFRDVGRAVSRATAVRRLP